MPTSNHSKQILIGNLKKQSLFCSQVFKTTSNVLNSDVNIDCFLFAGADKLGSLCDVEFKAVKCDIPEPNNNNNNNNLLVFPYKDGIT